MNSALRALLFAMVVVLAGGGVAITAPAASAAAEERCCWEVRTVDGAGSFIYESPGAIEIFDIWDNAPDGLGVTARFKWCKTCPPYIAGHNSKGSGTFLPVEWNWPDNDRIYLQACLSNGGKAPFEKCSSWAQATT